MGANDYLRAVVKSTDGNTLQFKPEYEERIHRIGAQTNAFLTVMRALRGGIETIKSRECSWTEEWKGAVETTVSTGATSGQTAELRFTDAIAVQDQIFQIVETGEQILCTAATAGQPTTIVRAFGTEAAVNITAGMHVVILGRALEEAQDKPTMFMRATNTMSTWTQKMAEAFGVSDVMQLQQMYGEGEPQRLKTQAVESLHRQRARVLLFSQPKKSTAAPTNSRWATPGVEYWCGLSNNFKMPVMTEDGIAAAMEPVVMAGEGEVIFFTGHRVFRIMAQMLSRSGRLRQDRSDTVAGIRCETFDYASGTARIVLDQNFDMNGKNDRILVVNPDVIKIVQSEPMQVEVDVQTPGAMRKETQITVCEGIKCYNPSACALIRGIRQAA